MNFKIKEIAIIGSTASGKSNLGLEIAQKTNSLILSLDSLSVYKEINIVSAKPSKKDLKTIKHFGIDIIYPDEYFSADLFIDLYNKTKIECEKYKQNLIIVGGSSFYLKSLTDGLSTLPKITDKHRQNVDKKLTNLQECYKLLEKIDSNYIKNIEINDSYRIQKAMLIYEATGLAPSQWFKQNPPNPSVKNLSIFNIQTQKETLKQRIQKRTHNMIELGLIDEICFLEYKYSRSPKSMSSIGIIEVLEFLDGKVDKNKMIQNISTHTEKLAKRQATFNKTQFTNIISAPLKELKEKILKSL